ncbi:hypothetical protein [Pandoraea bronchicola]|uniref:Uncharacterized protein n=1 Tax=Pandoraea bronchicola TaxID=2508287 RepID=A0A5E5BQ88_9BURK|nr:hypothetical protein [Pandoraea bronchicola]VVE87528.1 hypothetical protein PBR20603_01464 [Pandoraea bronchicola]
MKLAPLATLLCALPLAGCYVVQYPGGALTLSPSPVAPQAMRAAPGAPGAADVSTAPVPTPSVVAAPVRSSPAPPPPAGTAARQSYPNGSPVPPDYRPSTQQTPRTPVYPNGSPVPPDYVPPPTSRVPSGTVAYAPDPGYATYSTYPGYPAYPAYSAYPAYAAYPTYPTYPAYSAYPAYAPFYPAFGPSPWLSNVSFSFSWGRGWGGWGGRCCHRWR